MIPRVISSKNAQKKAETTRTHLKGNLEDFAKSTFWYYRYFFITLYAGIFLDGNQNILYIDEIFS